MIQRFQKFNAFWGSFFFLIPIILILATQEVRPSISNYAYSQYSYFFVSLISLSGFTFIVNGWLDETRFYNIILGASLVGVSLTPHLDFPIIHYSCAGLFFLGSVYVMIAFSSAKQRWYKIIAGIIIVATLLVSLTTEITSLLIAEWIAMLPISIHYVGEAIGKID